MHSHRIARVKGKHLITVAESNDFLMAIYQINKIVGLHINAFFPPPFLSFYLAAVLNIMQPVLLPILEALVVAVVVVVFLLSMLLKLPQLAVVLLLFLC